MSVKSSPLSSPKIAASPTLHHVPALSRHTWHTPATHTTCLCLPAIVWCPYWSIRPRRARALPLSSLIYSRCLWQCQTFLSVWRMNERMNGWCRGSWDLKLLSSRLHRRPRGKGMLSVSSWSHVSKGNKVCQTKQIPQQWNGLWSLELFLFSFFRKL